MKVIYTYKSIGPKTEIALKGRLTFSDYSTFREISQSFDNIDSCLLDLTELEFIDSAGLGMLLIARDRVKQKNGQIVLRVGDGQVKKMLNLGQFESFFVIEDCKPESELVN